MEEDQKKRYTFTDKRSRPEETRQDLKTESSKTHDTVDARPYGREGYPEIDFSTLIMSFASAAMISIGNVPDPVTGQISKNLPLAQQNIAIISLLREKTKGNLSQEEESLIDNILYELRLSYIEAKKG
ncbi:MAG TPA: DUF1844 domain-containing protein [Deltaproteobacteria bacterium]|jgi:hypothetical protein|nr:DUF1844 domain-containing protein [Deltaproteobacteria bacterium]HQI02718.1 DUF1844 domain-containing protein [Deltaproteobacteria bacterium]HQJ07778.1 DUF1844 domain-containing protein [Deltaproteobacteria bacterium]